MKNVELVEIMSAASQTMTFYFEGAINESAIYRAAPVIVEAINYSRLDCTAIVSLRSTLKISGDIDKLVKDIRKWLAPVIASSVISPDDFKLKIDHSGGDFFRLIIKKSTKE